MILGSVLNIILDPIFIYAFGLGVAGAAIATLISQVASFPIYVFFFHSSNIIINIHPSYFRPTKQIYGEILRIGISMF